jgi:ABC-type polysaccharide/polyol phosphate transport system ATPase subunit
MTYAIQAEHVYKQYSALGTLRIRTIAQDLARALRATSKLAASHSNPESRFVLNDVNFNLQHGESLGVIGHNGSGKTTLLRLLAAVSLPTKGYIRVEGKVAPLLALGAGFHPDLTGHENIFLNCTLMGLSRKQALDRIDQIINFADIGDYIEVPIKRYSSGMLARLGFAAAMHMDPEIILLDEVLAVGDYNFSIKANALIREFVGKGTLVLISHDLSAVEKLCNRVIWLDHGVMRADGKSPEVIAAYTQDQQKRSDGTGPQLIAEEDGRVHKQVFDPRVAISRVSVHDQRGDFQGQFDFGSDIVIRCNVHLSEPIPNLRVVMGIIDIESKAVVTACDNQLLPETGSATGDVVFEALFPAMKLRPRSYGVWVAISNPIALLPLITWRDIYPRFFSVGSRRDAEIHYWAPQGDLVFTPGVKMTILQSERDKLGI